MRKLVLILIVAWAGNTAAGADQAAPNWNFGSDKAKDAVLKFRAARQKLDDAYQQRRQDNRDSLIAQLEEDVKTATKANDLDDAVAIREAIKLLRTAPEDSPTAEGSPGRAMPNSKPADAKLQNLALPAGAVEFNKHYYLYVPNKRLLPPQTHEVCRQMGGHLVRLDNKPEHRFVVRLVQASGDRPDWVLVDGSDAGREGFWFHSNGKPVRYLPWGPGHPHFARERNHLAIEMRLGGAVLVDCMASVDHLPFVCEWDESELKALAEQEAGDTGDNKPTTN